VTSLLIGHLHELCLLPPITKRSLFSQKTQNSTPDFLLSPLVDGKLIPTGVHS